jgi:hypothetical protein
MLPLHHPFTKVKLIHALGRVNDPPYFFRQWELTFQALECIIYAEF